MGPVAGVSRNSRSRPFPRMKAFNSRSRIMGMFFPFPSRSRILGMLFISFPSRSRIRGMVFYFHPAPDFWECFFSHSPTLGMKLAISFLFPNAEKPFPLTPSQWLCAPPETCPNERSYRVVFFNWASPEFAKCWPESN